MFSKVNSLGLSGFSAEIVEVEADLSSGLPRFDLVGLPGSAVSESKQRVYSAIKNCGFKFPVGRITVNLAPAEFRKEGPIYDLPITIAILLASAQLNVDLSDSVMLGEVSLDGSLRPVSGVLPMTLKAQKFGFKQVFVPYENGMEAALVSKIKVIPVKTLNELLQHLVGEQNISPMTCDIRRLQKPAGSKACDFSEVIGQHAAKRALEVAAAGGHNLLFIGSPGSGKSMLARRLPSILPDFTFDEAVETTAVYSVAGALCADMPVIASRPFRSPHHTVTPAAMAGGGSRARPGEVSLAHNGVLFLDELPLFSRQALEVLRQPLEDGQVTVTRNLKTAVYPCNIMLVASMNPCPCGNLYDKNKVCTCSESYIREYLAKLSGPLLDRIDITIPVESTDCRALLGKTTEAEDGCNNSRKNSSESPSESSSEIRARVVKARELQKERFKDHPEVRCNSNMSNALVRKFCALTPEAEDLLVKAFKRLGLSARAHDRILKVARTIADLDGSPIIDSAHISEAIQYRSLDRMTGR